MNERWREMPIGDLVQLGKGGVWGDDAPSDGRFEAICLRGTDIAELRERRTPDAPVRWLTSKELMKAQCSKDMLLIETSGSRCGRAVLLSDEILARFNRPVVYSNFCRILILDDDQISPRYAELWFSQRYDSGVLPSYRATSAMPNLDIKSFLRLEGISLPPFPAQRRIVDLVASVDAYIAGLEKQAEAARTARNAVLHELLTSGGKAWLPTTLGEVARLEIGRTPPRNQSKYWTDDVTLPFCTIADMEGKWIDPQREGVTPAALTDGKARRAERGSLLMSFKLTIGRMGFASRDVFPNEAIVCIYPDESVVSKEFLYLWLGHQDLSSGSGRAVKGNTLNSKSLAEIPVAVPPLNEQRRVVDIIESVDISVLATERALDATKQLRASLLSDLLSGKHEIPEAYDKFLGAA